MFLVIFSVCESLYLSLCVSIFISMLLSFPSKSPSSSLCVSPFLSIYLCLSVKVSLYLSPCMSLSVCPTLFQRIFPFSVFCIYDVRKIYDFERGLAFGLARWAHRDVRSSFRTDLSLWLFVRGRLKELGCVAEKRFFPKNVFSPNLSERNFYPSELFSEKAFWIPSNMNNITFNGSLALVKKYYREE